MRFLIGLGMWCLCSTISAQATPPGYWFTDFAEAQQFASAHNGHVLMVFAGSDWCRPCMKFKKDVLQNPTFQEYAEEHLAILYLDFPARKKHALTAAEKAHHEQLAEQYNQRGTFPRILLLYTTNEILADLNYQNQEGAAFRDQVINSTKK